jgi:putative SOS response-associated peptidase YedK
MCNDFGNRIPYDEYLRAFSEIRVPLRFPTAPPNLEPRDDIWPTEPAPVVRRREDGIELVQLRWGFPPARPKGAPFINFRSEGRRFPKGRCLIPASHFFEFTGAKAPKSKWKFTKAGEDWFCFAGLWRPVEGAGDAFTLLTTEPDPTWRRFTIDKWSYWNPQTGSLGSILPAPKGNCCARSQPGA